MAEDYSKIQQILNAYIQDGSKTVLACFQEICNTIGLTTEFNVLACLEQIMKNNSEIAEYNARNMYDKSGELCQHNAALYTRIQQEIANKSKQKNESI